MILIVSKIASNFSVKWCCYDYGLEYLPHKDHACGSRGLFRFPVSCKLLHPINLVYMQASIVNINQYKCTMVWDIRDVDNNRPSAFINQFNSSWIVKEIIANEQ